MLSFFWCIMPGSYPSRNAFRRDPSRTGHFLTYHGAKYTLDFAFTQYTNELREERIGTAVSNECAKRSLNKFSQGAKFADVTPAFLKKYEKWMQDQENSITTVGIYLRSLRTMFNSAGLSKEFYRFKSA